jgi:predicted XRE-type DNA-binding protein
VNAILKGRGLNQVSAAARLGMPQPKVSAIRNYKLTGISLERLVDALVALDQRVKITVVSPKTGTQPGIEVIS